MRNHRASICATIGHSMAFMARYPVRCPNKSEWHVLKIECDCDRIHSACLRCRHILALTDHGDRNEPRQSFSREKMPWRPVQRLKTPTFPGIFSVGMSVMALMRHWRAPTRIRSISSSWVAGPSVRFSPSICSIAIPPARAAFWCWKRADFALPEHVQNLPMLGLNPPPPTNVDPGVLRNEVWGLPWRSNVPGGFPGLAYALGGRSLFFGGWSPRLLPSELPAAWPAAVTNDLNGPLAGGAPGYFAQAAAQIGTDVTNDFIFGPLHEALRAQLKQGIDAGNVTDAIPLAQLPLTLINVPPAPGRSLQIGSAARCPGRAAARRLLPLQQVFERAADHRDCAGSAWGNRAATIAASG